jgi:hypothetical protein
MGACDFTAYATGKTVGEAFDKARRDAQYEYGHGGYTGSIAEKDGYIEIPVPKGTTAERLVAKAAEASWAWESGEDYKPTAKERAAIKYLTDKLGQRTYERFMEAAHGDKWGPAAALQIAGAAAVKLKERLGRKGTHDKVFIFTGYASS